MWLGGSFIPDWSNLLCVFVRVMCRVGPLDGLPGLITGDNIVDQWFDLGEDEWYTRQKDGTRGCGKGVGKVGRRLALLGGGGKENVMCIKQDEQHRQLGGEDFIPILVPPATI